MNCPKCNNELAPVEYQGVLIDRCSGCNGLWFDAFEHEELKALGGSEAIDIGASSSQASTGHAAGLCPRCSVKMIDMVVAGQPHISYEACGVCHGVYFDAGEFRDFRE
ncbi:MAG: zf-TFIIB domain-containing protein, partial [Lysobacter sp.]|nr:zf-TFIIB domain-containing protein [Lysobacter sp.]